MKPIATQLDVIARPVRTRLEITSPDEAAAFLDGAYGAQVRLRRFPDPPAGDAVLTHTRYDAGVFLIDDVELGGAFSASPDPLHKVAAVWATRGRLSGRCGGLDGQARAGEVTLLSQPDLSHEVTLENSALTTVLLDPALVASVATGVPREHGSQPIRFSLFQPVDENAGRLWQQTVEYVKNCLLADDARATPLVLGHAGRLLAAVALSTFPNALTADSGIADRDAKPAMLQRAIDYIEVNLTNDIALGDIAAAVHVSPRAVQYMFRRHLDTTPVQYLRRARLHRAHLDLLAADRSQNTVTQIAAKWGFAHTGRFAVMYRETYGQSPHTTLRE